MAREQPWSDEALAPGRIFALTANPISAAVRDLAAVLGREVVVFERDDDGSVLGRLAELVPTDRDAVVLCDHDAPDAAAVLRAALDGPTGYVAMMASRRRSDGLLADLRAEGFTDALDRLHVPAGLDTGGKSPGEIGLSVLAEIVAWGHGRTGAPMRERS